MKKRNIQIDIIKVLAVFLVILVHFYLKNGFYDLDYHSKIMKISLVLRNFGMVCVPLFIMTTGYLLRDKEYSKKYFKGILKVYLIAVSIIILLHQYFGKAYNNFKTKNEKKIFVLVFVALTIIPGTVYEIISPIITYIGNENYRFLENILPIYWLGIWPLAYLATRNVYKRIWKRI